MKKTIYTYYDPIYPDERASIEQRALIEIWQTNWQNQGWKIVVLNKEDAKKNPRYSEYEAKFKTFPTVNHKDYELACFLRWVAMEMIGGYHCDYDVMNYGFKGVHGIGLTFYSKWLVPCMAYGTKKEYTRLLDLFMNYEPTNNTHVSDQSILVENVDVFKHDKIYMCPEIKQEQDWFKYDLVHYPNGVMQGEGLQPRSKIVKEFNAIIEGLR